MFLRFKIRGINCRLEEETDFSNQEFVGRTVSLIRIKHFDIIPGIQAEIKFMFIRPNK